MAIGHTNFEIWEPFPGHWGNFWEGPDSRGTQSNQWPLSLFPWPHPSQPKVPLLLCSCVESALPGAGRFLNIAPHFLQSQLLCGLISNLEKYQFPFPQPSGFQVLQASLELPAEIWPKEGKDMVLNVHIYFLSLNLTTLKKIYWRSKLQLMKRSFHQLYVRMLADFT